MLSETADEDQTGVTIRLLGPFEVHRDGAPVRITGRPATLLAILALEAGSPVLYRDLCRYLWPDAAPANSRRTLQTYAGRLRTALGPDAVVTRPEGFRLTLARGAVDLHRFRSLVREGRSASPHRELDALEAALRLWRGEPLSDLNSELIGLEYGPALIEELVAATERANDLRISLGQVDADIVPSLNRLVSRFPWRERCWAQLMTALDALGRRGEALEAFHRLVAILRDDLGIEPGPEISRLHQRILVDDAVGEPPGTSAQPVIALPVPAQLPLAPPGFVGRGEDVAALVRALSDPPGERCRVVTIDGPAGIGKTATALEALYRTRGHFPDGQLYLDAAASDAAPFDVLGSFLQGLGVHGADIPPSLDQRSAMFRTLCAERRLVVFLDGVAHRDQIGPLIPGAGPCAVVVTTRRSVGLPTDLRIRLGPLSTDDSHLLLRTMVDPARLADEPTATASIVAACGGSPGALLSAADDLAADPARSVNHYARLLTSRRVATWGTARDAVTVGR